MKGLDGDSVNVRFQDATVRENSGIFFSGQIGDGGETKKEYMHNPEGML